MRFSLFALACLISAAPSARAADVDLLGFDRTVSQPAPADAAPLQLETEMLEGETFETMPPVSSEILLDTPVEKTTTAADPKPTPPLEVTPAPAPVVRVPPKPVMKPAPVKPVVAKPVVVKPVIAKPVLSKDMLGVEDSLLITVKDEPDLSGTYVVAKDGTITLPLIGALGVAGKTPATVRTLLIARLSDGYLVNPEITVTAGAGP